MSKLYNSIHGAILFLYYFIFVSVSFFVAPFLIQKGIDMDTVGFLNAFGLIMLILSLFAMGFLADLKITNKKIISYNLIISAFVFLSIALFENFLFLSLAYILLWATFMVSTSLLDGLVLKDVKNEKYPQVRAMGSLGAAVSYFINSYALGETSFELIMYLNILLLIIIVFLLRLVKEHSFDAKTSFSVGLNSVLKNKVVLYIMIISFLTYGVIAADDAYTYSFSTEIAGISAFVMGVVGFISIGLEAFLMAMYKPDKYKKIQGQLLMFITAVLAVIFLTKGHFYESKFIINLGNVLLGVFTGLFIPIIIDIIDNQVDGSVKNSVLSFYQIAVKLGGAILGFITALYVSHYDNLPGIYDLHLGITVIGMLVIALLISELNKGKNA